MAIRPMMPALYLHLLCILMTIGTASGSGDEAALLAFKAGFTGSSSSNLASWNSSTSFCNWEGVTCSRRQRWPMRVVALSLPSSKLGGILLQSIGNLIFLRLLNLSSNVLHGEIPPSLGRLRRLWIIDLGSNSFSGAFPANLSSCVSLTDLNLAYNQLGGQIPMELGDTLTRLQKLRLENNSFTGPIPASLANLSSLHYLNIDFNHLDGLIPEGIGNNPALQKLFLKANSLSGEFPISLWNLSSLTMLTVDYNMLQGSIPANIGSKFPNMKTFGLCHNQFSGVIPSSLFNISSLVNVFLDRNRFTGSVPPTVGRLPSLSHLSLYSNRLEANNSAGWEFITSLTNCSQLQDLVLSDNSFRGQLPNSIVNLPSTLQKLYLDDNSISGSIPKDIGNLIGLDILDLFFTSLSGVIPTRIGKLTNLAVIDMSFTSLSGLIPSSIGNLTNLNTLIAYNTSLEGPIPASLGKLKKLFVLDFSNNRHNGSIPREILDLPSLSLYLDLSNNFLSGPLPTEIGNLVNLNNIILSGNQLSGQIPDSIGNCEVLESLLLEENSFEGSVPRSLGNLKGLTILNLTMNKFSGKIPDVIGSIRQLQQLCLAHNNFWGPIPITLQNLTTLWQLDVSFNNLQGKVPAEGVFKNLTHASVAGNDKLCSGIPRLQLPPCPKHVIANKNRRQWLRSLKIALPTVGTALVLVSAIVRILLHHRKIKQRNRHTISLAIEEQYRRVSYHALSRGSNEFSEVNLLGKGSYGSVYRCILEDEGASVTMAVKVFNLETSGSSRSYEAECEALRRVRHRSLIKIITCCSSIDPQGQEFKAIVFEFMPNGSLDDWIHPRLSNPTPSNTLSLPERLGIAVDILDKSAKVGDFGISKILPDSTTKTLQNSKSSTGIRGSIGYIAPEYGEGSTVTRAGDTYSLGILLLEMFTGRSPTDEIFTDSMDLHRFVAASFLDQALDIADPTIWLHEEANDSDVTNGSIKTRIIQQCLVSVLRLGISCSKQQPRDRIPLAEALSEMQAIRDDYLRSWMVGHEVHSSLR
uniref:Protein kinase domain-containing protein n=1 Tax=Leersia perrieri TaxID=77586 RepID=A0A0D9UWU6_9ORYZ